ncbi:Phosphohistidine phosphatase, SixA [Pseudomonas sp. 8Z]|uniref:phosphohistidine phosphatase SixA n=1 Tax=Pseudomonas sp. 8Z TaxID=2653166 RepID=UPI0012EEEC84|nr:phosphohistidine phosphatase SixA [Pseudomonas sp. 8Z]VXD01629.1 Phosphohistidine phosphatase, SixA [Pseudomonas sp. 8Z]
MTLWLLRHGQAEVHAASDAQRELTDLGRQEALQSAAHLLGQPLAAIIVSPYVRAQQTAQVVRERLGFDGSIITAPWLTPSSDVREAIRQLDAYYGQNVLLVSHQPLIGELGGLLLYGHRQQPLPMRTASLAQLQGEMMAAGSLQLLALHHPH